MRQIARGSTESLYAFYKNPNGGLSDPTYPLVSIRDSDGVDAVAAVTPTRLSEGWYKYDWDIAEDQALGIYTVIWGAGDVESVGTETVEVIAYVYAEVFDADDLCTSAEITDLLTGVTEFVSADWTEEELDSLKLWAKDYVERLTGTPLTRQVYTETYDGNGKNHLFLKKFPVGTILSLTIDSVAQDLAGIYTYEDRIEMESKFPSGRQNVVVQYSGGNSTITDAIRKMIAMICAQYIMAICLSGGGTASFGGGEKVIAGPITIQEDFGKGTKYAAKTAGWSRYINQMIRSIKGLSLTVFGADQQNVREKVRGTYDPRTDTGG